MSSGLNHVFARRHKFLCNWVCLMFFSWNLQIATQIQKLWERGFQTMPVLVELLHSRWAILTDVIVYRETHRPKIYFPIKTELTLRRGHTMQKASSTVRFEGIWWNFSLKLHQIPSNRPKKHTRHKKYHKGIKVRIFFYWKSLLIFPSNPIRFSPIQSLIISPLRWCSHYKGQHRP